MINLLVTRVKYHHKRMKSPKEQHKIAVQDTNNSSIVSKASMAKLGYFDDQYLSRLAPKVCRRAPLINRGYFIRAKCIDFVLKRFLHRFPNSQIVSLGAGYDSTYFRLSSLVESTQSVYVEIDFPALVKKKTATILNDEFLSKFFTPEDIQLENNEHILINQSGYKLIGCDLTDLNLLSKRLKLLNLDLNKPTLFLSEVVIAYMKPHHSDSLISWTRENFNNCFFTLYEQILPSSSFGSVMCSHFKKLCSPLLSINTYPTMQLQVKRFKDMGFSNVECSTVGEFFSQKISNEELARIQSIEPFDEYEEWFLKCQHYILLCASQPSTIGKLIDIYNSPELETPVSDESFLCIDSVGSSPSLERYGHTSTSVGDGLILHLGGFGIDNGAHKINPNPCLTRTDLTDLKNQTFKLQVSSDTNCRSLSLARMHHTTVAIGNSQLVVIGGRSSPARTMEHLLLTVTDSAESDVFNLNVSRISDRAEARTQPPCGRWRHSATLCDVAGVGKHVIIFGGKNQTGVFHDCFSLDISAMTWRELPSASCGRHSHSACVWGNFLLISGGLSQDEVPQSSTLLFDLSHEKWIDGSLSLPPRFGHSSCVLNDQLYLIGGIESKYREDSQIVKVDLNKFQQCFTIMNTQQLRLLDSKFLFHNHSSVISERCILIFGGGGNCFSFGTHFNQSIFKIVIK